MRQFEQSFTALSTDIDELGHVNNAVWVRWVQDLATAHWAAAATPAQVASYGMGLTPIFLGSQFALRSC